MQNSTDFPKNPRNKVVRGAKRGVYNKAEIHAILDEAFICQIAFTIDEQPYIIPTVYARDGDRLLIHGSSKNRMMAYAQNGVKLCVNITLLDGLVMARSAFHHSVNYRSVVIFGTAHEIVDLEEKNKALHKIMDNFVSNRWEEARPPNAKELKITKIIAIQIEEASAKVRAAGVADDKSDYDLPIWAGVVPTKMVYGTPISDERLNPELPIPPSIQQLKNK